MNYSVCYWPDAPDPSLDPSHVVAHRMTCFHQRTSRPRKPRKWRDFESLEAIRDEFPDGGETTVYGADPCCHMTEHFPPVPPELRRSARP